MSVAVDDDRRRIRQGVFDRSGVSYLVSDRVEADPAWPVVFTGTFHEKAFVIQQNPTALPRAYVVPRAEVVEDDDSATVLSQFRSSDPRASVLMDHDPLAGLPTERRQRFTPAHWISQDPDRPVLEVATEAPGLLVVADTWMPGWSARVDGQPASILRGNHAQRVIPLKHPGRHSIVLQYRPPGLATGCVISACAVLVWVTLCVLISGLRGRVSLGLAMTGNPCRPTRKPRIMSLRLASAAHRLREMRAIGPVISPAVDDRRCTRGGDKHECRRVSYLVFLIRFTRWRCRPGWGASCSSPSSLRQRLSAS